MFPHRVITLKKSPHRQEYMSKELNQKLSIEPHFHYGVDGSLLTEEELFEICKDNNILTRGEVGCLQSHLGIYQEMIDKNIPFMWIFEDDLLLDKNFSTVLPVIEKFANSIPQDEAAIFFPCSQYEYLNKELEISEDLAIYSTQYGIGAACYLINLTAAKELLRIQQPAKWPIDIWKFYYYLGLIKIYALNKDLYTTSNQFSSVIDQNGKRKHSLKNVSKRKRIFWQAILQSSAPIDNLCRYICCKLRKNFLAKK